MKKFGRKKERASVRLPKTAQQSIPIRRIHRDGIWEVDGKFSRCWRFTDINYAVADEEDKKEMLIQYCALEKALPTDAITKISIVNKRLNPLEFQKEMLMPSKQDGRDDYRKEYNRMLLDKAAEGNGIVQERYITVSVERRSMLVMLDAILNRVIENHKRGRRTWIYIDEIYLFFANEYSSNFLEESWKRFRKKNAAATGITQNVTDCLRSPTAKNMLANSEFLLMLSQAPTDQQELVKMLRISEEQLSYISNAESGHGLIKVGGAKVPFINQFPRNTALYRLMTTKPGESL